MKISGDISTSSTQQKTRLLHILTQCLPLIYPPPIPGSTSPIDNVHIKKHAGCHFHDGLIPTCALEAVHILSISLDSTIGQEKQTEWDVLLYKNSVY